MLKIKDFFSKNKHQSHKKNRDFFIGEYNIELKQHHILDEYFKKYPLYDRFLPILCSNCKELIIDIGANIGDTSIAIFAQNKDAFVVGVEPDTYFFEECMHNIKKNNLELNFLGINKFVSTAKGFFTIDKNKTASTGSISQISVDEDKSNTIDFTTLMELIPLNKKNNFDVLKIDTDGYDWDIINSFVEYAKQKKLLPRFVFFEMQTFLNNEELINNNRDVIINSYKEALQKLYDIGYNTFCLFDNFGTHVKITNSVTDVYTYMDYINRSQLINKNATIYYYDVLAFNASELDYVNHSLSKLYNIENNS
jgi:FkbM family methyltransferase